MTVQLVPGSATRCIERNPRPRNQPLHQAACDAAAADPDERRVVREFDACALFTGMTIWYDGEFRSVKQVDRPMSPDVTIHFVAPPGVRAYWFTKRNDPVYCLVDGSVTQC